MYNTKGLKRLNTLKTPVYIRDKLKILRPFFCRNELFTRHLVDYWGFIRSYDARKYYICVYYGSGIKSASMFPGKTGMFMTFLIKVCNYYR